MSEMTMTVQGDAKALWAALLAAKQEFKPVEKSAENPHFRSSYAPLSEFKAMADPVLHKHGLLVLQPHTVDADDNGVTYVEIATFLVHAESGAALLARSRMPLGQMTPQAVGSAITYGQRYQYKGLLGLADTDDDDAEGAEGRKPQPVAKLTEEQAMAVEAKVADVGADKAAFCRYLGVKSVADIPASRFEFAMKALDRKKGGAS